MWYPWHGIARCDVCGMAVHGGPWCAWKDAHCCARWIRDCQQACGSVESLCATGLHCFLSRARNVEVNDSTCLLLSPPHLCVAPLTLPPSPHPSLPSGPILSGGGGGSCSISSLKIAAESKHRDTFAHACVHACCMECIRLKRGWKQQHRHCRTGAGDGSAAVLVTVLPPS